MNLSLYTSIYSWDLNTKLIWYYGIQMPFEYLTAGPFEYQTNGSQHKSKHLKIPPQIITQSLSHTRLDVMHHTQINVYYLLLNCFLVVVRYSNGWSNTQDMVHKPTI